MINKLAVAVILLFISACDTNTYCIEGDDFGYPKIDISSDHKNLSDSGNLVLFPGNDYLQYSMPIDSGQLAITGNGIKIQIDREHNYWVPLMGNDYNPVINQETGERVIKNWSPLESVPRRECLYKEFDPGKDFFHLDEIFYDGSYNLASNKVIMMDKGNLINCYRPPETEENGVESDFFADCTSPCYIRHGVGLLATAIDDGGHIEDLNIPPESLPITHITDFDLSGNLNEVTENDSPCYTINSGRTRSGINCFLVEDTIGGAKAGSRIYFKLSDTYYYDNFGSYVLHLKCGLVSDKKGPFESIVTSVSTVFFSIAEVMYKNVVKNQVFVGFVRAIMILAVVVYTLILMFSLSTPRYSDLVIFIIKMGIVALIISDPIQSWFYAEKYILEPLISLIYTFSNLIFNYIDANDDKCLFIKEDNPWYAVDYIFYTLISKELWVKVAATLFSNALGFLFIVTMMFYFFIIIAVLAKLLTMLVIAFLILSGCIVIFPIYTIFLLFGFFKDYFNEILNQMMSSVLEIIMGVSFLAMVFAIFRLSVMDTLSYRVCYKEIFNPLDLDIIRVFWFTPTISDDIGIVDVDAAGNDVIGYIDVPAFEVDPGKVASGNGPFFVDENNNRYLRGKNFITIEDIIILILLSYILWFMHTNIVMVTSVLRVIIDGNVFSSTSVSNFKPYQGLKNYFDPTTIPGTLAKAPLSVGSSSLQGAVGVVAGKEYRKRNGLAETRRGALVKNVLLGSVYNSFGKTIGTVGSESGIGKQLGKPFASGFKTTESLFKASDDNGFKDAKKQYNSVTKRGIEHSNQAWSVLSSMQDILQKITFSGTNMLSRSEKIKIRNTMKQSGIYSVNITRSDGKSQFVGMKSLRDGSEFYEYLNRKDSKLGSNKARINTEAGTDYTTDMLGYGISQLNDKEQNRLKNILDKKDTSYQAKLDLKRLGEKIDGIIKDDGIKEDVIDLRGMSSAEKRAVMGGIDLRGVDKIRIMYSGKPVKRRYNDDDNPLMRENSGEGNGYSAAAIASKFLDSTISKGLTYASQEDTSDDDGTSDYAAFQREREQLAAAEEAILARQQEEIGRQAQLERRVELLDSSNEVEAVQKGEILTELKNTMNDIDKSSKELSIVQSRAKELDMKMQDTGGNSQPSSSGGGDGSRNNGGGNKNKK